MIEQTPPPQSADAERGVLCSALLAPDAVLAICGDAGVTTDWFFVPAHAEIYATIAALAHAGKPCDFITVAQHLQDRNRLEQVGGGAYLNELFVYLPTAANVRYYLEMLEEKHHLRGALAVAATVSGMATTEKAHEVLEYMESACLGIRANRYRKTVGSMREVAMAAMQAINQLYANKGRITGIETGFGDLDKLTNGAHPSELTIIAARPSVGKTALALNIAERMSLDGVLCLFFSGEMSQAQLGQRLLCTMARVNHAKVRQGFLAERDFPALTGAASRMKDLLLVIDDTTSPTIEYIRGVTRRHRRATPEGRLAVFIDYAGLCTTADNRARATRQLELGAVSRGAKALSKEVSAPVYLLSQLNRESSKQQRRPRLTDLRECLSTRDSFLFTDVGVQRNASSRMNTYSLNKANVVAAESTNIPKAKAKTITIVLSSGRSVTCTKKHLFLTDRGWVQAAKLDKSHAIASVRRIREPAGRSYIPESKWIGWMLGNGSMTGYASPSFICSCEDVANEFIAQTLTLFGVRPKPHAHQCAKVFQYDITASTVRTPEGNPVKNWLKSHDLWGRKALQKIIPQWWMELADDRSIAEMLAGLMETDGSVFKSPRPTVKFSSTSRELILQVLWCFARLGIFARLDEGIMNSASTVPCYSIVICEGLEINRFRAAIQLTGRKGRALDGLKVSLRGSFIGDRVGTWVSKTINELRKKKNISWRELGYRDQKKRISQATLERVITRLTELGVEVPIEIKRLVQPDLFWDRLKRIDDAGIRDVFDRNAPAGANFVCNGVIVHNSGDLEQDADNVFLLHRPEMEMEPDDDAREKFCGVAELIIAKQRNGSVGDIVPLTFLKEFTRFEERAFIQ